MRVPTPTKFNLNHVYQREIHNTFKFILKQKTLFLFLKHYLENTKIAPSSDKPHTQITMTTSPSSSQVNLNKNEPSSSANKEVATPSKKLTPKKKSSKKHKSVLQTKLHHLSMQIGYIGNNILLRKISC
jgi:hypothetical protein